MTFDPFRGVLGLDFETCSAADIKNGAAAYAEHPSTFVWCACFGYSERPAGPVKYLDWLPRNPLPQVVRDYIVGGGTLLAHNVAFEKSICRHVLSQVFPETVESQWRDTQAIGAGCSLPVSLEGLGATLRTKVQKDLEGAKVMRSVMKRVADPQSPDGWTTPAMTPAMLKRLIDYCRLDVATMLEAYWALPKMPLDEHRMWLVDQKINARGVYLDQEFAAKCLHLTRLRTAELGADVRRLSAEQLSESPSVNSLKKWLLDQWVVLPVTTKRRSASMLGKVREAQQQLASGVTDVKLRARLEKLVANKSGDTYNTESADRSAIDVLLDRDDLPVVVRAVLNNRREAAKVSSLAKLTRVSTMVNADGRLRYALRYHGAHTGRWSSSGLQLHNLPKDKLGDDGSALVRSAIQSESLPGLKLVSQQPLAAISQTLRSILAAPPGREIIGGDYSAIEARIVAWLAGQNDVVELFRQGVDVYTYAAKKIGSDDRQLGKVCTLALGFGMAAPKLIHTAGREPYFVSLPNKRGVEVVKLWRAANPFIVDFWAALENAVLDAIRMPGRTFLAGPYVSAYLKLNCLFVRLPSGRTLRYWNPSIVTTEKKYQAIDDAGVLVERTMTSDEIRFWKADASRMLMTSTYGGKLVENVTQAVARDVMRDALVRLDALEATKPYRVGSHVHDSIAAEVPRGEGSPEEFAAIMAEVPVWAPGLPLKVDPYRDTRVRG